jgi:peptide/nickel transport system permease protein
MRATRQITWSTFPLRAETAPPVVETAPRVGNRISEVVRWIAANRGLLVGTAVILVVSLAALLAPRIAPYDPDAQLFEMKLAAPGSAYLLGGDALGRDIFSRLIYAGRISLLVAIPSTLIALVAGVGIGSLAGYYGGWIDRALMRITDVVLVFPTFFLLILAVATFGRSLALLVAVIGLTAWPTNARVVRAQVLNLRGRDYVSAARAAGGDDRWIIWRHLVPQLIPIIVISATIRVANNILVESGLSFLGLGVAPPTPTWGNMVSEGADSMRQAWWTVLFPGGMILLVVLAFNLAGEGLRDLLDPRQKRR